VKRAQATLFFAFALGCSERAPGARDQWLVTIASDAPLPLLGDRLLVEVLDEQGGVCTTCRRVFVAEPGGLPISFGVTASPAARRVRARLYRATNVGGDGLPAGTDLIDAIGRLPPASGETEVALELFSDCFGIEASVADRTCCDPRTRTRVPEQTLSSRPRGSKLLAPGSWGPARAIACSGDVPADMVCIPGGVFLLGSFAPLAIDEFREGPERLVQLGPFALDAREVTVSQVARLVREGRLSEQPGLHSSNPDAVERLCTYPGPEPSPSDELPVNCSSQTLAAAVCAARGRRLPTEAEWEYAASNAGASTPYPWGDDPDVCARAHVGRGSVNRVALGDSIICHDQSSVRAIGPTAIGAASDVTFAGVHNLGGNVSEWVEGNVAPYDAECFEPGALPLIGPVCRNGSSLGAVRGGYWGAFRSDASVKTRGGSDGAYRLAPGGFRCALSR
jgi:formylglycine-generating enzyme